MVSYVTPYSAVLVVLDTNVVVAGIRSPDGASREILRLVSDGVLTPVLSVVLFAEYESVLKRDELLGETGLGTEDVDTVLDHFLARARLQRINFLWRPNLPDPDDDCVLECAVNGNAAVLVTFNKKDFPRVRKLFGVMVLTPREFLAVGTEG